VLENQAQPALLVVGSAPNDLRFIRILMSSMGCNCMIAPNAKDAVRLARERPFDAVLIDARPHALRPTDVIDGIQSVRPALAHRTLVITDTDTDSRFLEAIKGRGVRCLEAECLMETLWGALEHWLPGARPSRGLPSQLRLVFDSVGHESALGLRNGRANGRHLVYGSRNLVFHLWAERGSGPKAFRLTGQIMDSADPKRTIENIPVTVTSGTVTPQTTTTNQFGEFDMELVIEDGANVKMALSPDNILSIQLPEHGWNS
jgi:CheY-like chemotaxis protein